MLGANAPVTGATLSVPLSEPGEDAIFEDNFLDLVPGEVVEINVKDLNNRDVETRFLYDWEKLEGF